MAQTGSNFEGNYASLQSFQSGPFSELGLTLLPSYQAGGRGEARDHSGLEPDQIGNIQPFEDALGGFRYPSPTPTLRAWQLDRSHEPPNEQVNTSNSGITKQTLPKALTDLPAAPLFLHLRRIDRSGRVCEDAVTPAYISPPQYRPSAPHLHTFISTCTTLAATAQLAQLKERNKHLTMERDRFYHLCKPAIRRADDRKLQEIRELKAELRAARELNHKLQWALETEMARAQEALALAANQKPSAIQEGSLQESRSQSTTTQPAMTSGRRPPAPDNAPPSKRLRADSNTEKQQRKQHSLLNSSQMNDIQARLKSELKGKTSSYAWTVEDERNEVGIADKEEVTVQADIVREQAEEELSESEIAAFDRALEEDWDEVGDGHSLFGGG
jgi:hypothetical protein